MPKTYSEAGVDIDAEGDTISAILKIIKSTYPERTNKIGSVIEAENHFANLIDLGDRALAMCSDGVGTKVLLAQILDDYTTVGIDAVAMVANDLICVGAEPIALVDYYATEKTNKEIATQIIRGLSEGARQAGAALIGGETATLPDILKGHAPGKGFDLCCAGIGIADKGRLILGDKIVPGDSIIGIPSSGLHSNGFTLARKVLDLSDHNLLGDLLTPTRIYVKPILKILKECDIHYLAHITGSGLHNLSRLRPELGYEISDPLPPQPIFKKIQQTGISEKEMYRTFNMGMGFSIICPETEFQSILKHLPDAKIVGHVSESKGIRLKGQELQGKELQEKELKGKEA